MIVVSNKLQSDLCKTDFRKGIENLQYTLMKIKLSISAITCSLSNVLLLHLTLSGPWKSNSPIVTTMKKFSNGLNPRCPDEPQTKENSPIKLDQT